MALGRGTAPRVAPLVAALVVGLGLVAAPAVFQMFTRAPAGGRMIADFRPFMSAERLGTFGDHLDVIGAAVAEVDGQMLPALAREGEGRRDVSQRFPATTALISSWPRIREDMTGMLADIEANLDNFAAVDALPPFALFPWFFVAPGLLVAGVAGAGLRTARRGAPAPRMLLALGALGLAVAAAPLPFRMFSRAPAGAEMISELRPLMTREQVTTVQGYFVTIGAAEGEIRNRVLPAARRRLDLSPEEAQDRFPATSRFLDRWPGIASDMAPMVGVMADHLDSFAGVDALPPFDLFPWFFVAPGLLVAGLAAAAARPRQDRLRPSGPAGEPVGGGAAPAAEPGQVRARTGGSGQPEESGQPGASGQSGGGAGDPGQADARVAESRRSDGPGPGHTEPPSQPATEQERAP